MARATTTNTPNPEADLEAEIAALREDINSITKTLGDLARQKGEEAKAEAKRIGREARAKGEEVAGKVQDDFDYVESELKTAIRERPIQSVAIAAGVGYLLSKVFRL